MSWQTNLEREMRSGGERYTYEWFQQHPITRQIINAGILHGKICDVACGIGRRDIVLSQTADVIIEGVDIDDWAIRFGNREAQELGAQCSFQTASFYKLPYQDDQFDCCLLIAALEHAAYPTHLMKELTRITKPEGYIFLSVTENNFHADPDHKSSYSREGLQRFLSSFGEAKTWVEENIVFALVRRIPPSEAPFEVVYLDLRHVDTYTERWDQTLKQYANLVTLDCDDDGTLDEEAQEKLVSTCSTADVLHIGTGTTHLPSPLLQG